MVLEFREEFVSRKPSTSFTFTRHKATSATTGESRGRNLGGSVAVGNEAFRFAPVASNRGPSFGRLAGSNLKWSIQPLSASDVIYAQLKSPRADRTQFLPSQNRLTTSLCLIKISSRTKKLYCPCK